MRITDIIEESQKLSTDILERMIIEDAKDCGCDKCKRIYETSKTKKKG